MAEPALTEIAREFALMVPSNQGVEPPEEAFIALALVVDPDEVSHFDYEVQREGFEGVRGRIVVVTKFGLLIQVPFEPDSVAHQTSTVSIGKVSITPMRDSVASITVSQQYGPREDGSLEPNSVAILMKHDGQEIVLPLRRVSAGRAFVRAIVEATGLSASNQRG